MSIGTLANEDQNKRKGMRISLIIHAIILLLAIFWVLPDHPEKNIDTQYAVAIAFDHSVSKSNSNKGSSTSGKTRPKPTEVKKIETPIKKVEIVKQEPTVPKPKPTPTPTPKPTPPIVSEVLQEEAPIVAVDEDIVVDEPEPEEYVEPTPIDIPTTAPEVSKPSQSAMDNILSKIEEFEIEEEGEEGIPSDIAESSPDDIGGGPDSDGSPEDTGSGTGDAGDGLADGTEGNDNDDGIGTGGDGEGAYDGTGDGIFGRKVIKRSRKMVVNATGKTGKLVFKVCINKRGKVIHVELNELLTTVTDNSIIRSGLKAMWEYEYAEDRSAASEQCGKFTVNIDNYQGIR